MSTRTLAQLRNDAREEADMVGDPHKSDSAINRWINLGIQELWSLLVRSDRLRYLKPTPQTITTTSGTTDYALSTDCMEVVLVSVVSGSERWTVERLEFQELNRLRRVGSYQSIHPLWYSVIAQGIDGTSAAIRFAPDPGASTVEIEYVQRPQLLTDDGDIFDGIAGWEEYVTLYAAMKMAQKEQDWEAYSAFRGQLNDKRMHIAASASKRDARPGRIQDVRRLELVAYR